MESSWHTSSPNAMATRIWLSPIQAWLLVTTYPFWLDRGLCIWCRCESIHDLVQISMGINTNTSWSDFAKERARLPVRFKGLGLREAKERRYSQFIGGAAQSLIPLLNRKDKNNNTIVGRMHLPCIVNLLGEDSFDFPLISPWEYMLNNKRPTHNIVNGVQQTWSHLQLKFQGVATPNACDDDDLLVNQPVQRAGFRSNGTIPSSVTRDITMEIESAISTNLGKHITNTLTRKHYERWSWEGWTKIGHHLLHPHPTVLDSSRIVTLDLSLQPRTTWSKSSIACW